MSFKSLDELFKHYPWKTPSKFIPLANRYGFKNDKEIKLFLKNKAPHDSNVKIDSKNYLPIYSKNGNSYQFDTLIQKKSNPFLIIININTRKAYAYEMKNKGTSEVKNALTKFLSNHNVISMTSDQDSAYLSNEILSFLKSNNINYKTTTDNNHNVLGIINRFMRTLRDLNNETIFTNELMQDLISEYNNSPHHGINNKTPNQMNEEEEQKYIEQMDAKTSSIKATGFNKNDRVRIILEKSKLGKNRSNLSKESYIIDSKSGNQYIIRAKDNSIDTIPGYKLVKCDNRYPLANTIKNDKRGIVDKILDYNEKSDKYTVVYEGGVKDKILAKNLRESNPIKLSNMEILFWADKKNVPNNIKKWV